MKENNKERSREGSNGRKKIEEEKARVKEKDEIHERNK